MDDRPIDIEEIKKLSNLVFLANILIALMMNYFSFSMLGAFRELFEGMNLALPLATKLVITPLAKLVAPAALVALVVKEVLLPKPMQKLYGNVLGLLVLLGLTFLLMLGVLLPLYQLIGNLG